MLLGLAFPTSGTAELLGTPMPAGGGKVLHRVGSLVEGPAFFPFLSGWENLARCDAADQSADPRTARARLGEALERVGLMAAARKRYRNYSLGMKQRLAIAAGLLRPRDLIILDEPTNGLDPQGTREVRSLVRQIAADGITVFVSSHLLAEVEQTCSHVGVMRTGQARLPGVAGRPARTRTPPASACAPPMSRRPPRSSPSWAWPIPSLETTSSPPRSAAPSRSGSPPSCPRLRRGPRAGRGRPEPGGPVRRPDRRGVRR